jgi:DedD protein
MDQGLKERLVGAAVLVAIMVWLVPWILDGPETPLETGANSLQLPAAEEPMPMRTQTLRLGDVAEESAPALALAAPAEAPPASSPPEPSPVAEEREPVAAAPPASDRPAASPPTPTRVAATPAPAPPPAAAPAPAKGDWVVQLGSFSEEANARRLAERVGTFGYKAAVSSIRSNGRTLYRVRVGPMATRGQADATASALAAHGVTARVQSAD